MTSQMYQLDPEQRSAGPQGPSFATFPTDPGSATHPVVDREPAPPVAADPFDEIGDPQVSAWPSSTAPAVRPPRWSGKKTAVAAALALGLASGGAAGVAAAAGEGVDQTGQQGQFRQGGQFGGPGGRGFGRQFGGRQQQGNGSAVPGTTGQNGQPGGTTR